MKTKLIIFDMDGTLLATPTKELGTKIWLEKTGSEWPYSGWWGRKETLDQDIFDIPLIQPTHIAYSLHKKCDKSLLVLMTGRHVGLRKEVNSLLDKYSLEFDCIRLNDGKGLNGSGDTIEVKKQQILNLITDNRIYDIVIYEDRDEHIEEFDIFFKELGINHEIIKV